MARRSYYPSSVGGFADGFTQGFGLMQDAENARLDRQMAQSEIDATAKYRADTLAEDRRQFDEGTRQFGITNKREQDQFDAEIEIKKKEAEGAASLRAAQLSAANVAEAKSKAELDALERERVNEEGLAAMAQLDQVIKTAQRTGVMPDLQVINDLIEKTRPTKFDLSVALGKDFQSDIANFVNALSTQFQSGNSDLSDPRLEMGIDALIHSQGGALIGSTITDANVNAPEELQNGQYKIISREAVNIDIKEQGVSDHLPNGVMPDGREQQGPPRLAASADVLVTAEGPDGQLVQYIAPMTKGRSASTGERVQIPVNSIFDGVGGTAVMIDYLNKNMAEPIKAAKKEDLGGEAAFQQAVSAQQEAVVNIIAANEGARTFRSDKTNGELGPEDIQRIAEDRALGLGKKQESFRDDAKREIMQTKADLGPELKDYRVADADNNPTKMPEFSDAEILRLSLTLTGDGEITEKTRSLLRKLLKKKGAVEIRRGPRAYVNTTPDIPSIPN
jgi:hypothetical protein